MTKKEKSLMLLSFSSLYPEMLSNAVCYCKIKYGVSSKLSPFYTTLGFPCSNGVNRYLGSVQKLRGQDFEIFNPPLPGGPFYFIGFTKYLGHFTKPMLVQIVFEHSLMYLMSIPLIQTVSNHLIF